MVELQPKEIALHYLKKTFVFDCLGSFPTDLFFIDTWNHCIVGRKITTLVFVFRFVSLVSYSGKLAKDYEARRALYDFFSTMFWLIVILHWQACLYWIVPIAVVSMTTPQRPKEKSWINSLGLWDEKSDENPYGHCILRAIATLMHSGFLVRSEPETKEDQYLVSYITVLQCK